MKKYIKNTFLVLAVLTLGLSSKANSQTIDLLAGNTLNGAMNGVILGGATMGLQNSTFLGPIRVGVGVGTLYGIGMGVHDVAKTGKGEQFYISGFFNDGTNTSIIILLDTFYGAAAGAVVATSFTLIAKEPVVDGLQYGASVGSWAGFGFGLFDAFVLADNPLAEDSPASTAGLYSDKDVEGLVVFTSGSKQAAIGFLSPSLTIQKELDQHHYIAKQNLTLNLVNLNVRF